MTALKLFAVLLLVLGNGFFVAAEFALVAVRRSRIEQLVAEGRKAAGPVLRAIDNLDTYLAATQLGITITSLALGWIGEPALAHLIEPAFYWLPKAWVGVGAHTIAVTIAFVIITALHIVLGELAPKSLALQRSEGVALAAAPPLELFLRLFRPAIVALNGLGNAFVRLCGLKGNASSHPVHSAEELAMLVESSAKQGALGKEEGDIIRGVFRLADQPISSVMTPRLDMVWLDLDLPVATLSQQIKGCSYSRLPVGQGGVENIVGVLHTRDLLLRDAPQSADELRGHLHKPLFIPETAPSLRAIELLREAKEEMAIVVNEFGGVEGLVTPQDILDSIMSNMFVEIGETDRLQQHDGSWLLNAFMPIDWVQEAFELGDLFLDGSIHTLGGWIFQQLGRLPVVGDVVEIAGLRFEVADMLGHRIVHVRARSLDEPRADRKGGSRA